MKFANISLFATFAHVLPNRVAVWPPSFAQRKFSFNVVEYKSITGPLPAPHSSMELCVCSITRTDVFYSLLACSRTLATITTTATTTTFSTSNTFTTQPFYLGGTLSPLHSSLAVAQLGVFVRPDNHWFTHFIQYDFLCHSAAPSRPR